MQTSNFTNFDGALALLRASVLMLKRMTWSRAFAIRHKIGGEWVRLLQCLRYARTSELLSAALTAELLLLVDETMFYLQRHLDSQRTARLPQRRRRGSPELEDLISNYSGHGNQYLRGHWSVIESSAVQNPADKNFIAVAVQSNLVAFLELASKKSGFLTVSSTRNTPCWRTH